MPTVSISYSSSLWNAITTLLQLSNNFKTLSRNIQNMDSSFSPSPPFQKGLISLKCILEVTSTTALNIRTTNALAHGLDGPVKRWECPVDGSKQHSREQEPAEASGCGRLQQPQCWRWHGVYLLPSMNQAHLFDSLQGGSENKATGDFHNAALNRW